MGADNTSFRALIRDKHPDPDPCLAKQSTQEPVFSLGSIQEAKTLQTLLQVTSILPMGISHPLTISSLGWSLVFMVPELSTLATG